VAETLGKNPAGQSAGVHAMEDLIPEPPEVGEAQILAAYMSVVGTCWCHALGSSCQRQL
jgi:hypothetical protein